MHPTMRRIASAALALALTSGAAAVADQLKPGEILDQSTWQQAEGLLPAEILQHYQKGDFRNPIAAWPDADYNWAPDYLAASKANAGRFVMGPKGQILDKAKGEQPPYIYGTPFPGVDAKDPDAGVKIVWNYFYQYWFFGNLHAESQVNWISPTALERRSDQDVRFLYYDGVAERERQENPQNFLTQQLIVVKTPADLQGTAALTWRYRDPDKRDSTWSFVPALRRVRAVSPANRSDGFLGSDMAQDDGQFFDGKPEDFDWKVVGEKEQYRLADKLNLDRKATANFTKNGGWDVKWPDQKFLGYMDPEWKGLAWAPLGSAVLTKRKVWVVEGVPHDKYYLFGKIELMIDKITYQGSWNRKFSWKNELLNTMQVMQWNPIAFTRPDGKQDYLTGSNQAFNCAENLKLNRATVAGIKSSEDAPFEARLRLDPALFDVDALSRYGK